MIWLSIWTASIIINVVVTLKFKREEKDKIIYLDLFSFFVFGIIIAPFMTGCIIIGKTIEYYNKICNMDIMDKTIYKFK